MNNVNDLEYKFTCTKCKVNKENKHFHRKNSKKGRKRLFYSACKDCCNKGPIKSKRTKEDLKRYKLKYFFNLSYEKYLEILESQNYSCYICKVKESELDRKLAVDHCHTTNKIRGLLCGKCNKGIGMFNDNTNLLKIAIEYLEK